MVIKLFFIITIHGKLVDQKRQVMKKGLLIGNPVDKSISHITHNEIFEKCGVNAVYEKRSVSIERLSEEVAMLKKMDYAYFAVTMPLKELVVPFLDETREEIGSVNTIHVVDGRWIGYNFDGIACLNAIEKIEKVNGKRLLVLGAGGAARAAIYEAARRGAKVFIYNRSYERAQSAARQFGATAIQTISSFFDVIIQATPVGMLSDDLSVDMKWIRPGAVVMEMIYNPMETRFLREAIKKGARLVFGYEMFAELSFSQFSLVFGNQIDKDQVFETIKNFFIKY